jgi:ribosomal protein S18 acetylase RimI-like enzyme
MLLIYPTGQQYLQVKDWFSNHQEIYTWGGPNMTFPMSDDKFLNLLNAPHLHSFSLINDNQEIVAFGQYYMRLARHHLSRLVVNPGFRGQGLSKKLIGKLLEKAAKTQPNTDASLFVFTDNIVAYNCYQSLGFIETDYPKTPFPGNMQNCAYMVLSAAEAKIQFKIINLAS